MTFYVATGDPVRYERVAVDVGDQHIPDELLGVWDSHSLLHSLASLTTEAPVSGIGSRPEDEIVTATDSHTPIAVVSPGWSIRSSRGNAETEMTQYAVGGGDRVELSDGGKHSAVLDMLDSELVYLDQQQEYSYELSLEHSGVRLLLKKAIHLRECPSRLEFLFIMIDGCASVCWNDQQYDYKPGITRALVNEALADV